MSSCKVAGTCAVTYRGACLWVEANDVLALVEGINLILHVLSQPLEGRGLFPLAASSSGHLRNEMAQPAA